LIRITAIKESWWDISLEDVNRRTMILRKHPRGMDQNKSNWDPEFERRSLLPKAYEGCYMKVQIEW